MLCKKEIVLFLLTHRTEVLDICYNTLNEAIPKIARTYGSLGIKYNGPA